MVVTSELSACCPAYRSGSVMSKGVVGRETLSQLGMGPGEQRTDVAGARPEHRADLGVLVAVDVSEDERRPRDGPQSCQARLQLVAVHGAVRGVADGWFGLAAVAWVVARAGRVLDGSTRTAPPPHPTTSDRIRAPRAPRCPGATV